MDPDTRRELKPIRDAGDDEFFGRQRVSSRGQHLAIERDLQRLELFAIQHERCVRRRDFAVALDRERRDDRRAVFTQLEVQRDLAHPVGRRGVVLAELRLGRGLQVGFGQRHRFHRVIGEGHTAYPPRPWIRCPPLACSRMHPS